MDIPSPFSLNGRGVAESKAEQQIITRIAEINGSSMDGVFQLTDLEIRVARKPQRSQARGLGCRGAGAGERNIVGTDYGKVSWKTGGPDFVEKHARGLDN